MPICLHKINITLFRNYDALRLDLAGAPIVVLSGENGSGKTNILEAVSLLAPGKGLRGADLLEMKNSQAGAQDAWAIAAELECCDGDRVKIGTGLLRNQDGMTEKRRAVRIDGKDARGHNDLLEHLAIVWLTPQMDRLFAEGASSRRKFLDRLVFAYEKDHAARLNAYDKRLRERMKLLQLDHPADPLWLDELEAGLAADSVAITASRLALLEKLARALAELASLQQLFPSPLLSLSGWTEGEIAKRPALAVEEELKARFKHSRERDKFSGKSHEGAHRSDLEAFYKSKSMPAAQSSTGEQKALLVSVLIAHARLMRREKGAAPLLLLDEVAAHLDDARREQLFVFLKDMQSQVFLTGTEESIFHSLGNQALKLRIGEGKANPWRHTA